MIRKRAFGAVLACGIGAGMLTSPASADPANAKNSFGPFPVVCDNGEIYDVVLNGRGEFTPALVTNSTSNLVPVVTGPRTVIVTDPSGATFTETDPGSIKGQSASGKKKLVNCTYTFRLTDPSTGATVSGSGSVVGFVTPNGKQ